MDSRVITLGYVRSRAHLPWLYGAASAFCFPSLYEGFGLPILEAFACGCPVVTADNSSLREVGGDGALYSAAEDVEGIAANLLRVVEDAELRAALIETGAEQSRRFSWGACARATLETYRSVL